MWNAANRALTLIISVAIAVGGRTVADAEIRQRILNGSASSVDAPWMVSISLTFDGPVTGHICGGVLIDPSRVLTAAHCVDYYRSTPDDLRIAIGRQRLTDTNGRLVHVSGIITHPLYTPEKPAYDIAIVRLAEPVFLDQYPHIPSTAAADSTNATLLGWGVIYSDLPVRPDRLQQAEVPLVPVEQCSEGLGVDFDQATMLCAGRLATGPTAQDAVDACNGDSGGPLLQWNENGPVVHGIVSWGYTCGSDRVWGVYTNVFAFAEWINSQPAVRPFSTSSVHVSGLPVPGETLRCHVGSWAGDLPQETKIQWVDADTGPIRGRHSPRLKLRDADIGKTITCLVTVKGPGGEVEVQADEIVTILPKLRRPGSRTRFRVSRAQSHRSGIFCERQQCFLVVPFPGSIKESRAILTTSIGSSHQVKTTKLTDSTVAVSFKRNQVGVCYLRTVLQSGRSILTVLPCSSSS